MKTSVLIASLLATAAASADDLTPLSDEFDDPASISSWQRLYEVEGWNADQLETWDIDTSTPGHMRVMPYTSSWFRNLKGVLIFKEVTGDFVVTVKLTVLNRQETATRPSGTFSLSGIFVHGPRDIVGVPTPVPTGDPVWPPSGYSTDWQPNTDNYIFLSYGRASGGDARHQYEVKTTRNGGSQLYFAQSGVPAVDAPQRNVVKLQLVRVGDTAVVLRQHPGGDWIVENRYPNPDHQFPDWGETLQVGVTAYTDWATCQIFNSNDLARPFFHNYTVLDSDGSAFGENYSVRPDIISDVDYIRYQRPSSMLLESDLQALATAYNPATNTSDAASGALLGSGAGAYLGDAANIPLGDLGNLLTDLDGDGKNALTEYLYGTPQEVADQEGASAGVAPASFSFPHNASATAITADVQASATLTGDWETLTTRSAGEREWIPMAGTTVSIEDGRVVVVPEEAGNRRFFRIEMIAE